MPAVRLGYDPKRKMEERDGQIWLDGAMVPWREARVHVLTHTLHYGMGVFEGIRAYETRRGTAVFRLQEHVRRLFRSAHILGMKIPWTPTELSQACVDAVQVNNLHSAYIRPMCFLGSEGMGLRADHLQVHAMVAAWDWDTYLGEQALEEGIRVKTSSFSRHHVNSAMCKAKANGYYINSMLALQEALAEGYEEALMLDTQGFVAEGSGENIFIVRDEELSTPENTCILEGVTRDTVMQLAHDQGLRVKERRISRDEVYVADEAFFTGTAAEVTPIRELDGRMIGDGRRGPVTRQLQKLYFDAVHGRDMRHPQWLHLVTRAVADGELRKGTSAS